MVKVGWWKWDGDLVKVGWWRWGGEGGVVEVGW